LGFGNPRTDFYLFVYALQNPLLFCLLRARPLEDPDAEGHGLHMLHDPSVYAFEHNFAMDTGGFVYSDEEFVAPDTPVFVLEACSLRHGGQVASDGELAAP
jgi:hypothetical protein